MFFLPHLHSKEKSHKGKKNHMREKRNNDPVHSWLTRHATEMYGLLAALVNIQSGTGNKPGVDRVCRAIQLEMETMGFFCQTLAQTEYGDHLVARHPGTDPEKTGTDHRPHGYRISGGYGFYLLFRRRHPLLWTRHRRYERRTGDGTIRHQSPDRNPMSGYASHCVCIQCRRRDRFPFLQTIDSGSGPGNQHGVCAGGRRAWRRNCGGPERQPVCSNRSDR